LFTFTGSNIVFQWKHYPGFAFVVLTGILFYKSHQPGIIAPGFTILPGFFGQLSFSAAIKTVTLGINAGVISTNVFYGQLYSSHGLYFISLFRQVLSVDWHKKILAGIMMWYKTINIVLT
jgi:hypothetical protein